VGGGGLTATTLVMRRSTWGSVVSVLAGLMIPGFEAVELAVIGFTWLLALYILLGCLILVLAARLLLTAYPSSGSGYPHRQALR
jgi:hypothetical protein